MRDYREYMYVIQNEDRIPILVLKGIQNVIDYIKTTSNNKADFTKEKLPAGCNYDSSKSGEDNLINCMTIDIPNLSARVDKYIITKVEYYNTWK